MVSITAFQVLSAAAALLKLPSSVQYGQPVLLNPLAKSEAAAFLISG